MRQVERLGAVLEHFHEARLVQRRIGVGRTGEAGHAACHCGAAISDSSVALYSKPGSRSRADRSIRPGHDHQAGGIDQHVGVETGGRFADGDNFAGGDKQVRLCVDAVARVDQPAVLDMNLHLIQFPANMLITAMRTAMPNVTCDRITECAPSATAESISTPRFIGPGCMTMASGLASASFSGVRP